MKLLIASIVACATLCTANPYLSLPSGSDSDRYYGAKSAFEVPMSLQEAPRCYKYEVKEATPAPSDQPEDIKFTFNFDMHKPMASRPVNPHVSAYDAGVESQFGYGPQSQTELGTAVPSQCNCQECSSLNQGPSRNVVEMPSIVLPVRYSRSRRSTDTLKQKYQAKWDGHMDNLRSLKDKTLDKYQQTKKYAQEQVSKIKTVLTSTGSRTTAFLQGFQKNFEKPVTPRSKRSTATEANGMKSPVEQRLLPVLRVVEQNPNPCCPVIQELRENGEFRSRISQPDVLQFMPEVDVGVAKTDIDPNRCTQCGSEPIDSACACAAKAMPSHTPSQYFKYVDGTPVPFVPGMRQLSSSSKRSADSNYYVFDRLGHKYEENNGNLRLIATDFSADPQIAQPNINTFADIVDANSEVMHELNPFQGERMVGPVIPFAVDALDFVHDLARREAKYANDDSETKSDVNQQSERTKSYSSQYQIIPIRHENRNGSLIAKLSPALSPETAPPQPIGENTQPYEILTLDSSHQAADSAEEFDRIFKYLHSDHMKRAPVT